MPCGSSKDQQDSNGENGHCGSQDIDYSIVQHSLTNGVVNVKQILKCVQNGTREVKDLLMNECNIVYECKVCANLFRSLANFLYHKRSFCKTHICEGMQLFENFEEPTEVVHPEPSGKESTKKGNNLPQTVDCKVQLIKIDTSNIVNGKVKSETMDISAQEASVSKEKVGKNKNGKAKESTEDESEKPPRTASPMISRRTRLKNAQALAKRQLQLEAEPEPTKKSVKSDPKTTAVMKATAGSEKRARGSSQALNEGKNKKRKVGNAKAADPEECDEPVQILETVKGSEVSKRNDSEAVVKSAKVSKSNSGEREANIDSEEVITLSDSDEGKSDSEKTTSQKAESSKTNTVQKFFLNSPNKMLMNPLKKIVLRKPLAINLKSNVFNNIQKVIPANKMGFTSITNASGKSLPFPNIVLKAIEGNPHAVFHSADNTKPGISLRGKIEGSKKDGEKIIFLMKNNATTSTPIAEKKKPLGSPELNKKALNIPPNQAEFLLTRRKRLLQRSDCNVSELKCLTCNTSYNCLKSLFFHMMKNHSQSQKGIMKTHSQSQKRLCYPCLFCKLQFLQMSSVARHLTTIHNKSKEQVNKLRDIIKKKSFYKKPGSDEKEDEEKVPEIVSLEEDDDADEAKPDVTLPNLNTSNEINKTSPVQPVSPKLETVSKEIDSLKQETSSGQESSSETDDSPKQEMSPKQDGSFFKESSYRSPIKMTKDTSVHKCSKCGRSFGRKSSQVSHEKFCIMNAIQVDTVDLTGGPISPPPNVSFLSMSPKKATEKVEPVPDIPSPVEHQSSLMESKVSTRPKRGAMKLMHKDFVDSQTLKWRTPSTKLSPSAVRKPVAKTIEKKVMNIMSVEELLCTKCDKKFSSYSNLRRHVAIHVGWMRFKCKQCDYQSYNKSQCWAHLQKVHSVPEEDLDKFVVSINKNPLNRIPSTMSLNFQDAEDSPLKINNLPLTKIRKKKKKMVVISEKTLVEKKSVELNAENMQSTHIKKVPGKSQVEENKKEYIPSRKEKSNAFIMKQESDIKKAKSQNTPVKNIQFTLKTETPNKGMKSNNLLMLTTTNKSEDSSKPKVKSRPLGPIFKLSSGNNLKSSATSKPTTIVLSNKFSSPASILAFPPESMSSSESDKNSLRISPRRGSDAKIKPAAKKPSAKNEEELHTNSLSLPEKTYTKKDKLISEWFPKKDINSNARRESAPLIIGLVPASNISISRSKSPASDRN